MKRIVLVWMTAMVAAVALASFAGAQSDSLGDYARSVRKEKKSQPVKQFDNDNLPQTDKLSVVGQQPEPAPETGGSDAAAQDGDKPPSDQKIDAAKATNPADEKAKLNDPWKDKITTQKQKVELTSRELDVLQREYRLRAAAMYADAGNRLRNGASWDKEDQQYKRQIAEKQKAVDESKKQLDDLQEQARKAGVPSKVRE
jgi:hypothetical protein